MINKELVLVTGASSGIGLEMAKQFAEAGHDLILTARREAELNVLKDEIAQRHNVVPD